MVKSIGQKLTYVAKVLIAFLLLIIQYVPVVGIWHSIMWFPLVIYIFSLLVIYPESFWAEMNFLLFSESTFFGRLIAFFGIVLFLVATVQFFKMRRKLITKGLYSVVRHPQYLGIITLTFGYSLMLIQVAPSIESISKVLFIWLIQALGYVILAFYEERRLLREYGDEYQLYKRKVPFVFPFWHSTRIPEPFFSFILVLIIVFLCVLLFI